MDIPDAALKRTYAGAQAMAKFFIEQLDYGFVTNDARVLVAISDKDCIGCYNAIKGYAQRESKGWHQTQMAVIVAGFAPSPPADISKPQTVDVLADVLASTVVDSTGKTVESTKALKNTYRVRLQWAMTHWKVMAAGQAPA